MTTGMHEKMIEDSVRVNSGHVTVAGRDYLEKRSLDQFVRFDGRLQGLVDEAAGVQG
jgi:hypothetical protein